MMRDETRASRRFTTTATTAACTTTTTTTAATASSERRRLRNFVGARPPARGIRESQQAPRKERRGQGAVLEALPE